MKNKGCRTIYAKALAANDNRKQQVYFGGDFQAINIIPFDTIAPDPDKPYDYQFQVKKTELPWGFEDILY